MTDDGQYQTTYAKMEAFPIPKYGITYGSQRTYSGRLSCNDLINNNAVALVPNIDIGYYKKTFSPEDLEHWIDQTKAYIAQIAKFIDCKCEVQRVKLYNIEYQKRRCADLNLENIHKLPVEIVSIIHSYLLPETRIEMLLAKYPTYLTKLGKITERNLKQYMRDGIYENYYAPVFRFDRNQENRERLVCIEAGYDLSSFSLNCSPKGKAIDQIEKLLTAVRGAVPTTPENHHFYQSFALRMLISIIHIAFYKGAQLSRNRRGT